MTKYFKQSLTRVLLASLFLFVGISFVIYSNGINDEMLARQKQLDSVSLDVHELRDSIHRYQRAEKIIGSDYGYVLAKEDVGYIATFSSGEFEKVEKLFSALNSEDRMFDLEKVEFNFYEGETRSEDSFHVYLKGKNIIMARQ